MKKIITLFVLATAILFASTDLNAQGLPKIGLRAGVVSSSLSYGGDAKPEGDKQSSIGYMFGVTVDMNLPANLFIATGLDLVLKGAKVEYTEDNYSEKATMKPLYLQMPVHLGYKIKLTVLDINFSAGPYAAYGIAGKAKSKSVETYNGKTTTDTDKENFFSDEGAKKLDYGIGARVGVDVLGLNASLGYDLGLANIGRKVTDEYGDTYNVKLKNRSAYFAVGYKF